MERLQEITSELNDVRDKLRSTLARLYEAEGVLRFYSAPKTYQNVKKIDVNYQGYIIDDYDRVAEDTYVGGKKARDYFKRFDPDTLP